MSDNNDEKSFPGTLIDPDTCEHHHHTSHHQRHPHSHHAPALVELHIHLDGSFRHSTLFELAEKKGITLPNGMKATIEDFIPYVSVQSTCQSLAEFLEKFPFFLNIVAGDVEALERVAYEFVEDQAIQGVLYTEARYSPQVLMGNTLTPEQVIVAINRGFKRGIKEFHVDIRTLLCCIRPHPEWSMEVVDLANKYRSAGVVGIDLAGSEHNCSYSPHAAAFERAVKLGIHRTVHAGETGSADSVLQAIQQCHAERIGHGYAIVDDPAIYEIVHSRDIHLECCLTSSLHTNAVGKYMPTDIEKYEEHFMLHGHKTKTTLHMHAKSKKEVWHPIHHFARDHINFSLSCDDPSVSQITIEHEYEHALTDLKLSPAQLSQCVFNAARSSFLPENEKNQLIDRLLANYLPKQVVQHLYIKNHDIHSIRIILATFDHPSIFRLRDTWRIFRIQKPKFYTALKYLWNVLSQENNWEDYHLWLEQKFITDCLNKKQPMLLFIGYLLSKMIIDHYHYYTISSHSKTSTLSRVHMTLIDYIKSSPKNYQ
ncbi:unnamed protein product [Rotaria socialis]|uniref:adenosine deaminase n=1 Tax=Rotaria socialis TaxID=392032 RepID=A0A818Z7Y2_9BILA|nr:unnamed protein product [Rotaria socialis]